MKNTFKLALGAIAFAAASAASAQTTLLNASYDVAREFYKDVNTAFVASYKKNTGKDIKVDQSHGGSSAQARAVADGLDADVVTMNTTTDIDFLAEKGVVAKDWRQKFPNGAAPTTSTMLSLVRQGNPKGQGNAAAQTPETQRRAEAQFAAMYGLEPRSVTQALKRARRARRQADTVCG